MPKEERVETVAPPRVVEAPKPPPRPSVLTNVQWLRRPSASDLQRFYPDRALRMEKSGSATLRCKVTASGTLVDCEVTKETPDGFGFGDAAMKMTSIFKMKPQTKDGTPVDGGTVVIPVVFQGS